MFWQVLAGCISSCEDHGYIVDIGVKGLSAFLKLSEAEKYASAYGEGFFDDNLQELIQLQPLLTDLFAFH